MKYYDGLEIFINLIIHLTRIQFLFDEKKFHLKLPNRMLNQQQTKAEEEKNKTEISMAYFIFPFVLKYLNDVC